jgi:hypothetical protein
MSSLDDEYGYSRNQNNQNSNNDLDFAAQLSKLANAFIKDDTINISSMTTRPPLINVSHIEGIFSGIHVKLNTFKNDKRIILENQNSDLSMIIKINNLKMKMSDITLNVAEKEININIPGNKEKLSLVLEKFNIDTNSTKATFSKKNDSLTIKIYYIK